MDLNWINTDKPTLIYIGDPLCSWCYGIAPELSTLKKQFSDIDFRLVMGGLRPFNTEKGIEMADFLRSHWVEIAERTKQLFSYSILENPDFIYDTEPPARATVVARNMNPSCEFDFFSAIQKAFYAENKDTNALLTYTALLEDFNLDKAKFETLFASDELKEETKLDFQLAQDMGIKGFPALVFKNERKLTVVANGYDTAENISARINKLR